MFKSKGGGFGWVYMYMYTALYPVFGGHWKKYVYISGFVWDHWSVTPKKERTIDDLYCNILACISMHYDMS